MMLLASSRDWPDSFDGFAMLLVGVVLIGVPVMGYVAMVVDIRAYLRALRGALVRVVFHFPEMPAWVRYHTPYSIKALGLSLPCTESDVKSAYRQMAEKLHPDRGGDRQKFLKLQRNFEQAIQFLKDHESEFARDNQAFDD